MTNEYQKHLDQFEARRKKIIAALSSGMSAVQVARAFGISRARVYQIKDRERTQADKPTLDTTGEVA